MKEIENEKHICEIAPREKRMHQILQATMKDYLNRRDMREYDEYQVKIRWGLVIP